MIEWAFTGGLLLAQVGIIWMALNYDELRESPRD